MNRPEVTQKVIDTLAKILDAQDHKGLEKYGESIDAAKHEEYDWNLMALEEAADLTKYLIKENQKLRLINQRYEQVLKRFIDLPNKAWSDMAKRALEGNND